MEILYDEPLDKYTSIKIGGIAKKLYVPNNKDEVIELMKQLSGKEYYIIGGGSNLLINDKKVFDNVINVKKFDKTITNLGNGVYYVGASVRLQSLINAINKDGYGGIEYLYSVPGLVGGAIVMNAGRGKKYNLSISDYLINVHICLNGDIKVLKKEECTFKYRSSIFKNSNILILGATFCFEKKDIRDSLRDKRQRLEFCKKVQDTNSPNFGSVFLQANNKIMSLIRLFHPGFKNGIKYSKKTNNWLVNCGNGTFRQALFLIKLAQLLHKIVGKKAITEVIIWK